MFQWVFQKGKNRSIGTVFMYEKCISVSHGLGIAFGTVLKKTYFIGVTAFQYLVWKGDRHYENRICEGQYEGAEYGATGRIDEVTESRESVH